MMYLERRFAECDVILRQGGHVNRSDLAHYQFLCDHYDDLTQFYKGYGCNLVQHPDGFFFLLAQNSMLRTRLLPLPCVHLGMFIALRMRDPEITRSSGRIRTDSLLQAIDASVPRETLLRVYAPKQREASADARVTEEIQRTLKTLANLRFLEIQGDVIRPLEAIHRFAELARHENTPDDLARMLLTEQRGVVFQEEGESEAPEEIEDQEEDEGTD
jgi:chromosome partition protein MukE